VLLTTATQTPTAAAPSRLEPPLLPGCVPPPGPDSNPLRLTWAPAPGCYRHKPLLGNSRKFVTLETSSLTKLLRYSLFGWLVADGWCWFVLREEYYWLVAGTCDFQESWTCEASESQTCDFQETWTCEASESRTCDFRES
jgi:hypothetical protein